MRKANSRKDDVYRCPKEPKSKYFYLSKEDHDKRCKRCSNNRTNCKCIVSNIHYTKKGHSFSIEYCEWCAGLIAEKERIEKELEACEKAAIRRAHEKSK